MEIAILASSLTTLLVVLGALVVCSWRRPFGRIVDDQAGGPLDDHEVSRPYLRSAITARGRLGGRR